MFRIQQLHLAAALVIAISGCAASLSKSSKPGDFEIGMAVYYADSFQGRKTANGELYDKNAFTAAHRELPLGSVVKVTNLKNGKTAKVRINDRGPFGKSERVIDLSKAAATRIGMIEDGVVEVRIEVESLP